MFSFTTLASAVMALTALTHATAIPNPLQYREYIDTFDNETANPALAITPAGFQNNINYNNFSLSMVGALNGLKTASPPNAAVLTARDDLTQGTIINPTATATKSAAIKYFSLLSFFFGCVEADATGLANTAIGCDISVTGYNIYGEMVGEASFNYAPSAVMQAPMARADLPSTFVEVVSFTLGISTSTVTPALTALLFDNVTHINYW